VGLWQKVGGGATGVIKKKPVKSGTGREAGDPATQTWGKRVEQNYNNTPPQTNKKPPNTNMGGGGVGGGRMLRENGKPTEKKRGITDMQRGERGGNETPSDPTSGQADRSQTT